MREKDKQMLVDHYLDLYKMAFAVLRNESDVEDVVQEALAITMSRTIITNPYGYCLRVLRSCCIRQMDRNRYAAIESENSFAAEYLKDNDRLALVTEARANLSPRINKVIDLHFSDGLTFGEIAELMDVSESMAKKLFYKGLTQMRKKILEIETKEIFRL